MCRRSRSASPGPTRRRSTRPATWCFTRRPASSRRRPRSPTRTRRTAPARPWRPGTSSTPTARSGSRPARTTRRRPWSSIPSSTSRTRSARPPPARPWTGPATPTWPAGRRAADRPTPWSASTTRTAASCTRPPSAGRRGPGAGRGRGRGRRHAYAVGYTTSSDFPTTAGAYKASMLGFSDEFVVKLDPTGSQVAYATLLDGSSGAPTPAVRRRRHVGAGVAVDAQGRAVVAGTTIDDSFPTTAAFQGTFGGVADAVVVELNAAGSGAVYASFLGGPWQDVRRRRGRGPGRRRLRAGYTFGGGFATPGPTRRPTWARPAPRRRLPGQGRAGRGDGLRHPLRRDRAGPATGWPWTGKGTRTWPGRRLRSTCRRRPGRTPGVGLRGRPRRAGCPRRPGRPRRRAVPPRDAQPAVLRGRVRPGRHHALAYGSYLGAAGGFESAARGLAVDAAGVAWLAGAVRGAGSSALPTTSDAYLRDAVGDVEGYLTGMNPAAGTLAYSTYLATGSTAAAGGRRGRQRHRPGGRGRQGRRGRVRPGVRRRRHGPGRDRREFGHRVVRGRTASPTRAT